MASTPTIRPLPADVATQIKSSVSITSLNGVVIELLKNSLDACSRRIRVEIDYDRGVCTVEDDGLGIPPNEFKVEGGLLKLYRQSFPYRDTSKYNSSTPCHGSRGTFLASLAVLSLLSITSHHHLHNSHNTIIANNSKVIARQTPAPQIYHITAFRHGTRVVVRDLFGNMPVRMKQRALGLSGPSGHWREWEELRRGFTGLLLAWTTSVNVSVKDSVSGQKMQVRGAIGVDSENLESEIGFLSHVRSVLSQVEFITPAKKSSWISMRASTQKLSILGAISLEPAPTKTVQFISFGTSPLFNTDGRNILYLDINRLFRNSYFGEGVGCDVYDRGNEVFDDSSCRKELFTKTELKTSRKWLDRCPMFVIKIQTFDTGTLYTSNHSNSSIYDREEVLDPITELLSAMIIEFLRTHNFRPRSALPSDSGTVRSGQKIGFHNDPKGSSLVTQTHSERTGSPFDGWPRVKLGKRMRVTKESTELPKSSVLRCGKVVRQPFDDLPSLVPKDLGSIDCSGDELVPWTNPVTKEKLLVNSRTGFTVPSMNSGKQAYRRGVQSQKPSIFEGPMHERSNLRQNKPSWINEILKNWDNPVFRPTEPEIPQVSDLNKVCGETNQTQSDRRHNFSQRKADDGMLQELSGGLGGRLSKDALRGAEIIAQVDKKFILTKIWRGNAVSNRCNTVDPKEMLVIIDQHAADERCRIEVLLKELCTETHANTSNAGGFSMASGAQTISLEMPLSFNVSYRESQLFQAHLPYFARWGILYDLVVPHSNTGQKQQENVVVRSLPPGIIERCRMEPIILIDILRSEAWKCAGKSVKQNDLKHSTNQDSETDGRGPEVKNTWVRDMHDCPQGILDLLNSRACRSAIMFNDELSRNECKALVSRLAECAFPFQCAHGRPSVLPLLGLELLDQLESSDVDGNYRKSESFGRAFKTWKCHTNRG